MIAALGCAAPAFSQDTQQAVEDIFGQYCYTCHGTGWEGAPVLGSEAWVQRAAKGEQALLDNTINGIGGMPARGACSTCSDEELQRVIEWILEQQPLNSGAAPAPQSEPTIARPSAMNSSQETVEWVSSGGDGSSNKYTRLDQINAENVNDLQIAWRWSSPDNRLAGSVTQQGPSYFKSTPIMVNGLLYTSTSLSLVAAIQPNTGRTIWEYDPRAYADELPPANSGWQHRGVSYWADGDDKRIFITTGRGKLIALDADSGEPIVSFGVNGMVDLQEDLALTDAQRSLVGYSAPPAIVRDTVVVNCTVRDGRPQIDMPTCHVRGFDARTGARKWIFHTVPQEGEAGVETWQEESWRYTGNTNSWTLSSVDEELGYVYVPTGTPTNDYYGGHRKGDNLYAESLLCINAETGELVWAFQGVHHGLWDYDFPAAPNLVDIIVDGKPIQAVAQISKQGFTYVLDRKTGKPVWPIEERPVPQTSIPGEQTAATQPFPTRPPAFTRQGISEDDLIDFTPELKQKALDIVANFELGPLFTPPSLPSGNKLGTLQVPSASGGANWGGAGFDPNSSYLFVQSAHQPSYAAIAPGNGEEGQPDYLGSGRSPDISSLDGLPLLKPPYGTITAIDLNRGDIAWQVPNGRGPADHPAIAHLNLPDMGNSSHTFLSNGGPLVTGSLLFINQVQREFDSPGHKPGAYYLRAFDKATGELHWETNMDVPPFGTPMSYQYGDKQYIVVATGGARTPAELIAYALP
ncbi:MAG: PQQ-binding-like beta-propeller repeat protein [Pseudohongiellaceae bacterium]|nr:PQQ-binding-like beta-propeller repeat protein [Pseudohongiellaceae bacterium]